MLYNKAHRQTPRQKFHHFPVCPTPTKHVLKIKALVLNPSSKVSKNLCLLLVFKMAAVEDDGRFSQPYLVCNLGSSV